MRKAIASAGLAAMLSMGIGSAALAQTDTAPAAQVEADEGQNEDDGSGDKLGLLGLVGLLGLAGLVRRGGGGGGRSSAPRSSATKAPRGGHTTDWSSR